MSAFATVADLRARWSAAPVDDARVEVLLEDAGLWLASWFLLPAVLSDDLSGVLRMVSCSMVKRALLSQDVGHIESQQVTAGPFSQTQKFSNPDGNLYLTVQERQMVEKALDTAAGRRRGMFTVEAESW